MIIAARRDVDHEQARNANQVVPGTVGAGLENDQNSTQPKLPPKPLKRRTDRQISIEVPINKNAQVIETKQAKPSNMEQSPSALR